MSKKKPFLSFSLKSFSLNCSHFNTDWAIDARLVPDEANLEQFWEIWKRYSFLMIFYIKHTGNWLLKHNFIGELVPRLQIDCRRQLSTSVFPKTTSWKKNFYLKPIWNQWLKLFRNKSNLMKGWSNNWFCNLLSFVMIIFRSYCV